MNLLKRKPCQAKLKVWILIRRLRQKQAEMNLHCFKKRINPADDKMRTRFNMQHAREGISYMYTQTLLFACKGCYCYPIFKHIDITVNSLDIGNGILTVISSVFRVVHGIFRLHSFIL